MRDYLEDFFEQFSYPEEACAALVQAYDKIRAGEQRESFEELLRQYEENRDCDLEGAIRKMSQIAAAAGIHEFTGHLLMFICMSRTLRRYYREAGLEEKIWFDSMCDLKYKLMECKEVYGIWGTFVAEWYPAFFQLTRFGFLRLQFEPVPFGHTYEKNGMVLSPENQVINIHIPRTGGRLDRESVKKSCQQAAVFFKNRFQIDPPVFVCDSWLLYPRNREILSPGSNILAFLSDFDIIEEGEYGDYSEVWRLFDKKYEGDVERLPQDTSMRRAYAEWIRRGEATGWGYGVRILSSGEDLSCSSSSRR